MNRLIDSISLIIWLFMIVSCGEELPYILGGTLIFFPLLALIYFFSYVYKRYQFELSVFALIVLSLIGINFLSYFENAGKLSYFWILHMFCSLAIIAIVFFTILGLRPFSLNLEVMTEESFLEIKKKIGQRLNLLLGFGLVFCASTGMPFLVCPEARLIENGLLKYVPIATFWFIISFIVTLINLKKIEKYTVHLISKDKQLNLKNTKKIFLIGLAIMILFGSVLEIQRGAWVQWIETYSLFTLCLLSLWSIWQFVFENKDVSNIKSKKELFSLGFDLKTIFIIMLIYTVLVTIYMISFIAAIEIIK